MRVSAEPSTVQQLDKVTEEVGSWNCGVGRTRVGEMAAGVTDLPLSLSLLGLHVQI